MTSDLVHFVYLLSAVLFIFGLKKLTKVKTAATGNKIAALAMFLAIVGTLLELHLPDSAGSIPSIDYRWIIGGIVVGGVIGGIGAVRVAMTSMPEMVALFNGFGGGASALVAAAVVWDTLVEKSGSIDPINAVIICLSVLIGALTTTGSIVAFLKLQGKLKKGAPILLPGRHVINLALVVGVVGVTAWFAFSANTPETFTQSILALTAISLVLGWLLVIPIGGADMPVVVSLLNSYSGIAACAAGFVIGNNVLIIAGSMVGAAGLILTQIMCVAMNRSLVNVLVGGFGATDSAGSSEDARNYESVTSCGPEEAAMVLDTAESVIVVPGYGLAVAQAQHAVRELATALESRGTKVTYAIHPVAGRMPGHMNVLLAEADVPYEQLVEMDNINPEFKTTDAVIVIGANDVVNPAASTDKDSPIYGMPILQAHEARTVFVIKRSLSPGYAGIKNGLFELNNTMMVFGDAKQIVQGLVSELAEL
ncbi:MAG: NAD(P)(+) transhydrogenase (Re/Si-specific) subunit beta [Deltaproteobacteria bacterium]|jgi:H+-translocating NAD(P) transhydrogenase subunit beta|nr:NAD(P)(+) transhydrogenase (Re/Si-specific) subunit beta [Deltaproteobacteria bacterium]MBT6488610.1 NAD(P)(+) transhydrogenase (Re/Si-specific) subunit beta [Deltaproteobacteria bacterium]